MMQFPVVDYPAFTEEVTLDNVLYIFDFNWNSRGQFWSAKVSDRNGNVLISGIKVMINIDTFGRYKRISLPSGMLLPINNSGTAERIQDGDIGSNVNLIYLLEAEIVALG